MQVSYIVISNQVTKTDACAYRISKFEKVHVSIPWLGFFFFFICDTHDKTKGTMKENQYEKNSNMESFQLRLMEGQLYQALKSLETLVFHLALENVVKSSLWNCQH